MNAPALDGCDCHVHVFDPARFPFRTDRAYTPGAAPVDRLQAHLRALGLRHVVLVQPSVYGSDAGCLLDALAVLGGRGRGVAVLDAATPDGTLERLDRAGVVAARVNAAVEGTVDAHRVLARLREAAAQAPAGWHLQLHATLPTLAALAPALGSLGRRIVLDHYGLLQAAAGAGQPGWRELLALLRGDDVSLKLSAPYLVSRRPDESDLADAIGALADAAPARLVWGSNWPHTQGIHRAAGGSAVEPFRRVDDAAILARLRQRLGDALFRQVLAATPRALYGFADPVAS